MKIGTRGFRGFQQYLDHLCWDRNLTPENDSEPRRWLRTHVTDAIIEALTPAQLDRLERTVSALLGVLRASVLVRQGFSIREWRPTSARQPGVRKLPGHGSRYFEWRHDLRGWHDHPYRLTRTDQDGRKREYFVSEPYGLDEAGLRSLVTLMDEGWRVRVDADWALHYPGSTLRVCLMRKEDL